MSLRQLELGVGCLKGVWKTHESVDCLGGGVSSRTSWEHGHAFLEKCLDLKVLGLQKHSNVPRNLM